MCVEPEDYCRLIARDLPVGVETVPLAEAVGRILARDVAADAPIPGFATSAMDGYAFDAQALGVARTGAPITVAGDIPAGHPPVQIPAGCAVRVMTGAQVPDTAEAVVPVELTDASRTGAVPDTVVVAGLPERLRAGWNIRDVGEDTALGDVVAIGGQRLNAAGVGTLAMLGITDVEVLRRPRIGLIVTGDELRGPHAAGPTIPNSNLPMLAAAITAHGGTAVPATSGDDPAEFLTALDRLAPDVDLVITTGGISAGAYEVVRAALDGESSQFLRVDQRPGGPQGYGQRAGIPLLHLPGTPSGAYLSFHLFVRSLLSGIPLGERWQRAVYTGPELAGHRRGMSLVPVTLAADGCVVPAARARLRDFAAADAILRVPGAPAVIADGDIVDILPTGPEILA